MKRLNQKISNSSFGRILELSFQGSTRSKFHVICNNNIQTKRPSLKHRQAFTMLYAKVYLSEIDYTSNNSETYPIYRGALAQYWWTPGPKKVKISQTVETKPNFFENMVPAKFNTQTTLEADVNEENRQFDFELLSK